MRQKGDWRPSKFVYAGGRLQASRDPQTVGIGSRLAADVIAQCYGVLLAEHCRGRLLDLGCGQVPLYAAYRDRVGDTICADWPSSMHGNAHVDALCDLGRPLPFGDGVFDTVLLSDVLEHIPTPLALCGEVARVLAPGGRFVMNVPFFYWLHEQPHDYYRYTEHALRRFMDESGLAVISLAPVGGAPEILADVLAKYLMRMPRLGRRLSALLQWLAIPLLRPKANALWTRPSASSFPLGYFLVAQKPAPTRTRRPG